jgi:hypothetical protein
MYEDDALMYRHTVSELGRPKPYKEWTAWFKNDRSSLMGTGKSAKGAKRSLINQIKQLNNQLKRL